MSEAKRQKDIETKLTDLLAGLGPDRPAGLSILDLMPELVVLQDLKHRIIWANQVACDSIGLGRQEIRGRYCYEVWAQRLKPCPDCPVAKAIASGRAQEAEMLTPDGRVWEIKGRPLPGQDGLSAYALEIGVDITARLEAQRELSKSQEQRRAILDGLPVNVSLVSPDLEIQWANRAAADSVRAEAQELIGRKCHQVWGRSKVPCQDCPSLRSLESGVGEQATKRTPDGREWDLRAEPVFDDQGQITGLIEVALDITEAKESQERLRKQTELIHCTFEGSMDRIEFLDRKEHKVVYMNRGGQELMEIEDLAAYLNRPWIELWEPGDQERIQREVDRAASQGRGQFQAFCPTQSGRSKCWDVLLWPLPKSNKGKECLIAVSREITAKGLRAAEASKALETDQGKDRSDQALDGVIHTLASLLERRDVYAPGCQDRVACLARAIAQELDLDRERIEGLYFSAFVRDIGKFSIPAEILTKPDRLSSLEANLFKSHPQLGHEVLKDIEFPWPVAEIVLQHHERLNGTGYPQGLMGEEISLEARILAVAEVVVAMTSDRPYREAYGLETALRELELQKGNLYDRQVVQACLALFREQGFEFTAPAKGPRTR